ncbi:hypothetical protein KEM55_005922 [Ascosphaera atra]|nr:hypothetical protein KEM55_005922 [Ascosphaera atra]
MSDPERTPLLLVACGSFSPITYLHLRMFEMAQDYVKFNTKFELVGGYLSPVSDAYKKVGLANARHRVSMCELAVKQTSTWLMIDPWEPMQKEYVPTAKVLDHFDHEINTIGQGIETGETDPETGKPKRKSVRIALLAGADLIHTMSTPGVWSQGDLDHILGKYGTFIVERTGTDIDEAIASLQQYQQNIYVIHQMIQNDVSSTKIRMFLRREMSVRYLIPGSVIDYIEKNRLYEDDSSQGQGGGKDKEKEKEKEKSNGKEEEKKKTNGDAKNDNNDNESNNNENSNNSSESSSSSSSSSDSDHKGHPEKLTPTAEEEGLDKSDTHPSELKLTRAESNFTAVPHPDNNQDQDENNGKGKEKGRGEGTAEDQAEKQQREEKDGGEHEIHHLHEYQHNIPPRASLSYQD